MTDRHRFNCGSAWVDICADGELDMRGLVKLRAYLALAFFDDLDDAVRREAFLESGSAMELAQRERDWLEARRAR